MKIVAVDFDGTICTDAFPAIGEPVMHVIDAIKREQANGSHVILWTCRVGDRLEEAVSFCKAHGITFDSINENAPANVAQYNTDPRKVYADEYWDDKAKNPNNKEPKTMENKIKNILGFDPTAELAKSDSNENNLIRIACGIYRRLGEIEEILAMLGAGSTKTGVIKARLTGDAKKDEHEEPVHVEPITHGKQTTLPGFPTGDLSMPVPGEIAKEIAARPRVWSNTVKVYETIWNFYGTRPFVTATIIRNDDLTRRVSDVTRGKIGITTIPRVLTALVNAKAATRTGRTFRLVEPTDELREAVEKARRYDRED